jgi:hypothetical protein
MATVDRPGYRTTEFYVSILTALAVLVASIADYLPPRYAAISAAIVTAAYAIARGLAKQPPVVVPPVTPTTLVPPPQ